MSGPLPEPVTGFLGRYIHSVDQLEILLLLYADANRLWSTREISARMRRPETAVVERLQAMLAQELIHHDNDRYRYSPGRHDADVNAVKQCFATRRPAVIATIFADR